MLFGCSSLTWFGTTYAIGPDQRIRRQIRVPKEMLWHLGDFGNWNDVNSEGRSPNSLLVQCADSLMMELKYEVIDETSDTALVEVSGIPLHLVPFPEETELDVRKRLGLLEKEYRHGDKIWADDGCGELLGYEPEPQYDLRF